MTSPLETMTGVARRGRGLPNSSLLRHELSPYATLHTIYVDALEKATAMHQNPALRRQEVVEWGVAEYMPLRPTYVVELPGFQNGRRYEWGKALHHMKEEWGEDDREKISSNAYRLYRNGREDHIATVDMGRGTIEIPFGNDLGETVFRLDTVFNALAQHLPQGQDS